MKFVPNSRSIVFADFDGLRLWTAGSETDDRIIGPGIRPDEIAFSVDGLTLFAGLLGEAPQVFRLGFAQEGPPIKVAAGGVSDISITGANEILVSSQEGKLNVLSAAGLFQRAGPDSSGSVFVSRLSPNGMSLARGGQANLEVIDPSSGQTRMQRLLTSINEQVVDLRFFPIAIDWSWPRASAICKSTGCNQLTFGQKTPAGRTITSRCFP